MPPLRQLTGHDASFLYADTVHANANVTFIQIYDPITAPGGTVRFKSILAHIESRLHRSPLFRSKLLRVPLELDNPYWVEDEHFDLEYHVRHIALPKPGDWRQLCIQASRIHARALDLHRPLWEIYVIEGLDSIDDLPPGSFALLTKIHHAALDMDSHHEVIDVLHDTTRKRPRPVPPARWFPERAPSAASLLCRSAVHAVLSPSRLMGPLSRMAPAAKAFARDLLRPEHAMNATRFNAVVSAHRVFDTRRFMVEEFERIRRLVPGATLDDAVLAVCAGGLRRYLDTHGELPAADLAARTTLSGSALQRRGGASAARLARLGTCIADPVRRLALIHDDALAAGSHEPATDSAARAATHALPTASCNITRVPAPAVPLYLGGARMTYFSAILPIADGLGLVFAVTRYDGRIVISPTSCRELLPDPHAFTQCVRDSFQEYLALAPPAADAPDAVAPRAKPARPRASASGTRSPAVRKARKAATTPAAAPTGRPRSTAPRR